MSRTTHSHDVLRSALPLSLGLGLVLLATLLPVRAAGTESEPSLVDQLKAELEAQTKALQEQNERLKDEVEQLKKQNAIFKSQAAGQPPPDRGSIPAWSNNLAIPNVISDIRCRPQLAYKSKKDWKSETIPDPDKDVCAGLDPVTRLLLENLTAGATAGYSNVSGSPNVGANLPVVQTSTSTYMVGIGYSQKPILAQIRAIGEDPSLPRIVTNQGSTLEDFVFNAVRLNAGMGYGKTLQVKNGDGVVTSNTRPTFFVGLTYALDLERAYVHLFHGGADNRPADPGYFVVPACANFWAGNGSCSIIK